MTKTRLFLPAVLLASIALLMSFGVALAHTTVHAGKYTIEVGWFDEPPVVGQRNAVVVNIADSGDATKTVDVSKLLVSMSYGGQSKALTLQPLSEDTTNQYVAPLLPMIPGLYTVQLRGQVGDGTDVNLDVQPEEVVPADALAFPGVPAGSQGQGGFGPAVWLSGGALLVALLALGLSIVGLRRPRA